MPHSQEDPVLISSRREAWIVFCAWLIALTWSVSYCYTYGYVSDEKLISDPSVVEVRAPADPEALPELWIDRGKGPEQMKFVLGFPDWIFYGVVLPWWVCTAFSLWFGMTMVRDEDLGAELVAEDEPFAAPEHSQPQQGEVHHA